VTGPKGSAHLQEMSTATEDTLDFQVIYEQFDYSNGEWNGRTHTEPATAMSAMPKAVERIRLGTKLLLKTKLSCPTVRYPRSAFDSSD